MIKSIKLKARKNNVLISFSITRCHLLLNITGYDPKVLNFLSILTLFMNVEHCTFQKCQCQNVDMIQYLYKIAMEILLVTSIVKILIVTSGCPQDTPFSPGSQMGSKKEFAEIRIKERNPYIFLVYALYFYSCLREMKSLFVGRMVYRSSGLNRC